MGTFVLQILDKIKAEHFIYLEIIMKHWPLPETTPKILPENGKQGSFWEDRGDRHHAGIDLYAPPGTPVFAIENGTILSVDCFTSPDKVDYWNVTYSILIQNEDGQVVRYAELGQADVCTGESILAGQKIGTVGLVLNFAKIGEKAPGYIQRLKTTGSPSMLHLEYHTTAPKEEHYLGGNYFLTQKPDHLLDPVILLDSIPVDGFSRES